MPRVVPRNVRRYAVEETDREDGEHRPAVARTGREARMVRMTLPVVACRYVSNMLCLWFTQIHETPSLEFKKIIFKST